MAENFGRKPFVNFATRTIRYSVDLFRNADLLLVSPKVFEESKIGESKDFRFYKTCFHLKMLWVFIQKWSACLYLNLLGIVFWNPNKATNDSMIYYR